MQNCSLIRKNRKRGSDDGYPLADKSGSENISTKESNWNGRRVSRFNSSTNSLLRLIEQD